MAEKPYIIEYATIMGVDVPQALKGHRAALQWNHVIAFTDRTLAKEFFEELHAKNPRRLYRLVEVLA